MLTNDIKLAIRLLIRNPFFSLINIVGLSLGFAAFLVLMPLLVLRVEATVFTRPIKLFPCIKLVGASWHKPSRYTNKGGEMQHISASLHMVTRQAPNHIK